MSVLAGPRRAALPDPMAAPHVDVSVPAFGGSIRMHSASGPLEAVWIHVRDPDGHEVSYDRATGQHLAAAVRLTPKQARVLAEVLLRYARSHKDTEDE